MPPTPTRSSAWQALLQHRRESAFDLRELFDSDPGRFDRFTVAHAGILFDYSKHRVNDETVRRLAALADACDLRGWIGRMMSGERINKTEDRPVLHTALRAAHPVLLDGHDVTADVKRVRAQMRGFCDALRGG